MTRGRFAIAALLATLASGCVRSTLVTTRPIDPAAVREPGWLRADGVPLIRQRGDLDCGPAAVAMVVARWQPGARLPVQDPGPGGMSAAALRGELRDQGLTAFVIAGSFADLEHELAAGRPVIVGTVKALNRDRGLAHYEVVVAVHPGRRVVVTLDPTAGWRQNSYDGFAVEWGRSAHTTIVTVGLSDSPRAAR